MVWLRMSCGIWTTNPSRRARRAGSINCKKWFDGTGWYSPPSVLRWLPSSSDWGFRSAVLKENQARRRAVAAEKNEVSLRQQAQTAEQNEVKLRLQAEASKVAAETEAKRAEAAAIEAKSILAVADFAHACRLIAEDNATDALAYLARSLSANPSNAAAAIRLTSLLMYHTWMGPGLCFGTHCPGELSAIQF